MMGKHELLAGRGKHSPSYHQALTKLDEIRFSYELYVSGNAVMLRWWKKGSKWHCGLNIDAASKFTLSRVLDTIGDNVLSWVENRESGGEQVPNRTHNNLVVAER